MITSVEVVFAALHLTVTPAVVARFERVVIEFYGSARLAVS